MSIIKNMIIFFRQLKLEMALAIQASIEWKIEKNNSAEQVLKKWMGRYASLNQNIDVMADPTPMDVDHAAHAFGCIGRHTCLLIES